MQKRHKRRQQKRGGIEVYGQSFTSRLVGQARASASEHGPGGSLSKTNGEEATDNSRPRRIAVGSERPREKHGAGAQTQTRDGRSEWIGPTRACGRIECGREAKQHLKRVSEHQGDRHAEQPPIGFQKAEAAMAEGNPQGPIRGERPGEQDRQEGSQAACGGQTKTKTDVEDKTVHGTVVIVAGICVVRGVRYLLGAAMLGAP